MIKYIIFSLLNYTSFGFVTIIYNWWTFFWLAAILSIEVKLLAKIDLDFFFFCRHLQTATVKYIILIIIILIKKMASGHITSLICFICPGQIKKWQRIEKNPNWNYWENAKVKCNKRMTINISEFRIYL